MKKCPQCAEWLPAECFSWRRAGLSVNSYCRPCQRAYSKAHYRRNAKLHNQRRRRNQERYRRRNRERVREYLSMNPCIDCAESDIRVLEFDHVRGTKEANISNLVREGWAWQRIVREIAKCEVRCANCHRRRTVEKFGWPQAVGA